MILCSLCMKLQKPIPFFLYKTCIFEMKPYFLFIVTKKKWPYSLPFFKNNFILNLCNKINEFLTWTNYVVQHVLYNILLICIFLFLFFFFLLLQAVEKGNSKLSYFFPKTSVYSEPLFCILLYLTFIHFGENNQEV